MELKKFDFNEKRLRSRIKENFTIKDLEKIYEICLSYKFNNNNDKVDKINEMLIPQGFMELGAGTNRYAVLKDNYVYKISLDKFGFDDNETEFKMCPKLLDFGATKTYETNGLIAVAEYVNIITLEEFHMNKNKIRELLNRMSKEYLFADLGVIDKNFRNWGWDDNYELKFLDYGYVFERDENLLRCIYCKNRIVYDLNFNEMICSKCRRKFRIHDIKSIMEGNDRERAKLFAEKKIVKISFSPGYDWKKEEETK